MKYQEYKSFILRVLKEGLSSRLHYHSYEHILDVYHSSVQLASAEGIGVRDQVILYTAVLAHDAGFLKGVHKDHEDESIRYARKVLPQFDYTGDEIDRVCDLIQATKIPQTPKSKLGEIICDADLDYLGRDDFDKISNLLYLELQEFGLVDSIEKWNRIQVDFLSKHSYFTPTAKRTRNNKKNEHLDKLKALVASYD